MKFSLSVQTARVKGIAFHPSRTWVLVGLHNGLIQLYDYRTNILLQTFDEHSGPVRSIDFHISQPLFVSCGDDYTIKVWNYQQNIGVQKTRSLFTLTGHLDYIRTVSFHREYPWIVSASDDQSIKIWNWQSRACICTLGGHSHYVMSAAFHPTEDLIVSSSLDQTIRIWDISGLAKKLMPGRSGGHPSDFKNNKIKRGVSDINLNISHAEPISEGYVIQVMHGHERGVNYAVFHPDFENKPFIVSGSDDRRLKLWRVNGGTRPKAGSNNTVSGLQKSYAENGEYYSPYSELQAWQKATYRGHTSNVSQVMFCAKKDLIVSCSEDKSIRVYDIESAAVIDVVKRAFDRFWCLAMHPYSNIMAAGHDTGFFLFKLFKERPAFVNNKGTQVYYINPYKNTLRLFDFNTLRDEPIFSLNSAGSNGNTRGKSQVQSAGDKYKEYNHIKYNPNNSSVLIECTPLESSSINSAQNVITHTDSMKFVASSEDELMDSLKQCDILYLSPIGTNNSKAANIVTLNGISSVWINKSQFLLLSVSDKPQSQSLEASSANTSYHQLCELQLYETSVPGPSKTSPLIKPIHAYNLYQYGIPMLSKLIYTSKANCFAGLNIMGTQLVFFELPVLVNASPAEKNKPRIIKIIKPITSNKIKRIMFNDNYSLVSVSTKNEIFVYDTQSYRLVASAQEKSDIIKSEIFDNNNDTSMPQSMHSLFNYVVVYTTFSHIKYLLMNSDHGIIRNVELPVYLIGIQNEADANNSNNNKYTKGLYVLTRDAKPFKITLDTAGYQLLIALMSSRQAEVLYIIKNSKLIGQSIISYLIKKGYADLALCFIGDIDLPSKFQCAIEAGNLELALSTALQMADLLIQSNSTKSSSALISEEDKQKLTYIKKMDTPRRNFEKLAAISLQYGNFEIYEKSLQQLKDFSKLTNLYLLSGNLDKLQKMKTISGSMGDYNSELYTSLILGDIGNRVNLFNKTKMHYLSFLTLIANKSNFVQGELLIDFETLLSSPEVTENVDVSNLSEAIPATNFEDSKFIIGATPLMTSSGIKGGAELSPSKENEYVWPKLPGATLSSYYFLSNNLASESSTRQQSGVNNGMMVGNNNNNNLSDLTSFQRSLNQQKTGVTGSDDDRLLDSELTQLSDNLLGWGGDDVDNDNYTNTKTHSEQSSSGQYQESEFFDTTNTGENELGETGGWGDEMLEDLTTETESLSYYQQLASPNKGFEFVHDREVVTRVVQSNITSESEVSKVDLYTLISTGQFLLFGQLVSQAYGITELLPLKPMCRDIFLASKLYVSSVNGSLVIDEEDSQYGISVSFDIGNAPANLNQVSDENGQINPSEVLAKINAMSLSDIVYQKRFPSLQSLESLSLVLKAAHALTTNGKFTDAITEYRRVMYQSLFLKPHLPVEALSMNAYNEELAGLKKQCSDYVIGLTLENIRRELKETEQDLKLAVELAVLNTKNPWVQQIHKLLIFRTAIQILFKVSKLSFDTVKGQSTGPSGITDMMYFQKTTTLIIKFMMMMPQNAVQGPLQQIYGTITKISAMCEQAMKQIPNYCDSQTELSRKLDTIISTPQSTSFVCLASRSEASLTSSARKTCAFCSSKFVSTPPNTCLVCLLTIIA